jgi:hypothetical protein
VNEIVRETRVKTKGSQFRLSGYVANTSLPHQGLPLLWLLQPFA